MTGRSGKMFYSDEDEKTITKLLLYFFGIILVLVVSTLACCLTSCCRFEDDAEKIIMATNRVIAEELEDSARYLRDEECFKISSKCVEKK